MSEKVDCPLRGKKFDCRLCDWYDVNPVTSERECRTLIASKKLDDAVNYLALLLKSGEAHRSTEVEKVRTALTGEVTKELKLIAGLKDAG